MARELLKHVFKKPITLLYPFKKLPPVKGLRGRHVWYPDRCTGCGLCSKICPAFAIELLGKGTACAGIKIHLDRCLFCAQCEESCPTDAIKLTELYELADFQRERLVLTFAKEKK